VAHLSAEIMTNVGAPFFAEPRLRSEGWVI